MPNNFGGASAQCEWAVGFVNFYTKDLLRCQFERLANCVFNTRFRIIVVDNSPRTEIGQLSELAREYGLESCVSFIDNSSCLLVGSSAHAEGLNLILDDVLKAGDPKLLVQDPDFFWFIDNHLGFLSECLSEDQVAVGGPYRRKVGLGQPDFPSAWGAAYKTSILRSGDFGLDVSDDLRLEVSRNFNPPRYEFSLDVGWKIRERCGDNRYTSFSQRPAFELTQVLGNHSYESNPVEYFFEGRLIAVHLFRGGFPTSLDKLEGGKVLSANQQWNAVKVKYGRISNQCASSRSKKFLYQLFCSLFVSKKLKIDRVRYESAYLLIQNYFSPYVLDKIRLRNIRKSAIGDVVAVIRAQLSYIKNSNDFCYHSFYSVKNILLNNSLSSEEITNFFVELHGNDYDINFKARLKSILCTINVNDIVAWKGFTENWQSFVVGDDEKYVFFNDLAQLFRVVADLEIKSIIK